VHVLPMYDKQNKMKHYVKNVTIQPKSSQRINK